MGRPCASVLLLCVAVLTEAAAVESEILIFDILVQLACIIIK